MVTGIGGFSGAVGGALLAAFAGASYSGTVWLFTPFLIASSTYLIRSFGHPCSCSQNETRRDVKKIKICVLNIISSQKRYMFVINLFFN